MKGVKFSLYLDVSPGVIKLLGSTTVPCHACIPYLDPDTDLSELCLPLAFSPCMCLYTVPLACPPGRLHGLSARGREAGI